MIDAIYNFGLNLLAQGWWTGAAWPVIWNLIKIVVVLLPLMGAVGEDHGPGALSGIASVLLHACRA